MAVPVPVTITMQPPPSGWTGDSILDIATLIANSLSGTINVSLVTGQVGGAMPSSDVGPWVNGDEWWYYVPGYGYQPSEQGCPVGTIAMWGQKGGTNVVPPRWLLCFGQQLSIANYPRLFNAVGYTWGAAGTGNFRLPPSGRFFMNAQNFFAAAGVPIDSGYPNWGLGAQGGAQQTLIPANALPTLQVTVPYLQPDIIDTGINLPNLQGGTGNGYDYPVTDDQGNPVGKNQQPIPIMPPFVLVDYIIKYV